MFAFLVVTILCNVSLISGSPLETLLGYDSCVVFFLAQVFLNAISITTGCGMALFRMVCIRESNQSMFLDMDKVQYMMKKVLCGEIMIILTILFLGLYVIIYYIVCLFVHANLFYKHFTSL